MIFIRGRSTCGIYWRHELNRSRRNAMLGGALVFLTGILSAFSREKFHQPYDSETNGAPMSAYHAAQSFKMPPGFKVTVFASEPNVRQPIAMTFDARGRLWVAENYTYAEAKVRYDTNLSDRVLIFEDTNHDGQFDKRTIFYDRAKVLTSVAVGMGGVYLLCPPRLLFIPDRNHDDIPDGEPEVLLDGFDVTGGNHHTLANGLRWGPDGWLWGRLGISNTPRLGRPGAPESERVHMNGGIWRYHPTRHVVEAVCHGTTNPWGLDWNPVGEPFFINTVIGHLWHAIPGAHFKLMYGDDTNPHTYGLIDQHADHYHFDTGQSWMDGSSFASGSDSLGGGHAHTGLMIYQGDNWPAEYRGKVFTINFHGRRINVDQLKREGAGYVGQHDHDLLTIGDPWFRGIDLIEGPDGGVFISDWSDTGECHDNTGVSRSSGRIYKVTYGHPKLPKFGDLTRLSDKELMPALFATDEWTARHARRELSNRAFETGKVPAITHQLERAFAKEKNAPEKLRALWALDAIGATSNEWLLKQTHHADESIRSWAVRLLADRIADVAKVSSSKDQKILKSIPARFAELARNDSSALVRLYLASALQKVPLESRRELALALVHHPEDVGDHNLGLMIWFGIEPLVSAQPESSIELALTSEHRIVRQYIARRLAEDIETKPLGLEHLLAAAQQGTVEKAFAKISEDILRGMKEALHGWRKAKPPTNWEAFAKRASTIQDGEIQNSVQELSVLFGDRHALELVRQNLIDTKAEPTTRRQALRTLLEHNAENLASSLKQLVQEKSLGIDAIIALIELNDSEGADFAVKQYQTADDKNRLRLLAALVTRPVAATVLLKAIGDGLIPRSDLTPFYARQIASLNDAALTQRLGGVWGSVHSTDAEKRASIDRLPGELSEARLKSADLSHGRQVFNQVCAACHKLYGEGGDVGPDLTGSGRANLDYLLENIIDPSAVVPADYRMAIVNLKDDRVLNGVLRNQTKRTVSIQSQTGLITVERSEIESLQMSALSMMPEGLLQSSARTTAAISSATSCSRNKFRCRSDLESRSENALRRRGSFVTRRRGREIRHLPNTFSLSKPYRYG